MISRDVILVETVKTHRTRLLAALVYGELTERRVLERQPEALARRCRAGRGGLRGLHRVRPDQQPVRRMMTIELDPTGTTPAAPRGTGKHSWQRPVHPAHRGRRDLIAPTWWCRATRPVATLLPRLLELLQEPRRPSCTLVRTTGERAGHRPHRGRPAGQRRRGAAAGQRRRGAATAGGGRRHRRARRVLRRPPRPLVDAVPPGDRRGGPRRRGRSARRARSRPAPRSWCWPAPPVWCWSPPYSAGCGPPAWPRP